VILLVGKMPKNDLKESGGVVLTVLPMPLWLHGYRHQGKLSAKARRILEIFF